MPRWTRRKKAGLAMKTGQPERARLRKTYFCKGPAPSLDDGDVAAMMAALV